MLHGELGLPPAVQLRQHAPALHALPARLPLPPTGKLPPARRGPQPGARAPRAAAHPALGRLRAAAGAPLRSPRHGAGARRGERRPSAGSPRARAALGGGPEFGASLATFPKAREGAAGGVSGEAGGEGAGVLGAAVTLGNFAPGRGGRGGGELGPSPAASGKPGGSAEAAAAGAPSSAAAGTARGPRGRRATRLVGLAREAPELRPGEGAGARLLRSAGLRRKLGLVRGAERRATLSPQSPRTLHGRCARSSSCCLPARLPACRGVRGGGPAIPPNAESVAVPGLHWGWRGHFLASPRPLGLSGLRIPVPAQPQPAGGCGTLPHPPRPPTPPGSPPSLHSGAACFIFSTPTSAWVCRGGGGCLLGEARGLKGEDSEAWRSQADGPGACAPQPGGFPWDWVCTWAWVWRWEAEGRRDLAQLPVRVRPGPRVSSEHVLPPPLPCVHLKVCFLETVTGSRWGRAFGWWVLVILCPLGREPRKKGPLQVVQEELWTCRQRWGPQS